MNRQLCKTYTWKRAHTAASSHPKFHDSIHAHIQLHHVISQDPPKYLIMFISKHASTFINLKRFVDWDQNISRPNHIASHFYLNLFLSFSFYLFWPFSKGKNNQVGEKKSQQRLKLFHFKSVSRFLHTLRVKSPFSISAACKYLPRKINSKTEPAREVHGIWGTFLFWGSKSSLKQERTFVWRRAAEVKSLSVLNVIFEMEKLSWRKKTFVSYLSGKWSGSGYLISLVYLLKRSIEIYWSSLRFL